MIYGRDIIRNPLMRLGFTLKQKIEHKRISELKLLEAMRTHSLFFVKSNKLHETLLPANDTNRDCLFSNKVLV